MSFACEMAKTKNIGTLIFGLMGTLNFVLFLIKRLRNICEYRIKRKGATYAVASNGKCVSFCSSFRIPITSLWMLRKTEARVNSADFRICTLSRHQVRAGLYLTPFCWWGKSWNFVTVSLCWMQSMSFRVSYAATVKWIPTHHWACKLSQYHPNSVHAQAQF